MSPPLSPTPRRMRRLALVAVPAAVALLVAGCGSNSKSDSSSGSSYNAPAKTTAATTSSASVAASGGKVTIDATEFAFAPKAITAKAGKLAITLDNKGKTQHELVVLKTSASPATLKVSGGRVSESDSVGDVSETAGGASKSKTLDLKAGSYVYVCNIPGHYGDGMYGTLTVK
jgi:uncharacterized cupredoxin-like copper-binding protein